MILLLTLLHVASLMTSPCLQDQEPLVPYSSRLALRGVAGTLSKSGRRADLDRLQDVLLRGGDPADTLEKLRKTWDRNLERPPRGSGTKSALKKLRIETKRLGGLLERGEESVRTRLAELILELDSQEPRANEVLGYRLHDGRWMSPVETEREAGRVRVAQFVQEARFFPIEVETGTSASSVLLALNQQPGVYARAQRLTLHAAGGAEKLERILRQTLRALLLSNALVSGSIEVPDVGGEHSVVFTDTQQAYDDALLEARENEGISEESYERIVALKLRSFVDRRGWRTSRWRSEADSEALLLWVLSEVVLGHGAQPCLVAGHLNWLSLNFLGTSMPSIAWSERVEARGVSARTTATKQIPFQAEALWRSARHTLHGCRAWMVHRVLQGLDPPWVRSMTDQLGKVTDENLLKSTLVAAYLQELGDFPMVLDETRQSHERVASFETSLGVPLDEFEEQWKGWLLGHGASEPGLVQQLEEPPARAEGGESTRLLGALNRIRRQAFEGQWPEFESVAADVELSAGALLHALYLSRNEKQKRAWPDAHEEYAGREGFTPAGSRAGLRSVIAFTDDPLDALEQWMGTFYHRLPLLNPGLFGVGFAAAERVAVLDVDSLVLRPWRDHWVQWPADGARDVPLSFVPELPSPVPGEDQGEWGYPITLQVYLATQVDELEISMRLLEGGMDGAEVECWLISPQAPLFAELAPAGAWCLIPKAHLRRSTSYTVAAECPGSHGARVWSFRTR